MLFIVTGMHRSGTSMVAGLLHHSGIKMGSQFRSPLPENPKGFYEEEAFRCFNDKLLKDVGYFVKDWNPDFNGVFASANSLLTAASLVEQYNNASDNWGWKDPRTCLTIDFWLNAIDAAKLHRFTKIIVIERSIRSVSRSLYERGNISSISEGIKLCRMYNAHLTKGLSEYSSRNRVLRIRYERLLQGLDIDSLESFCGLKLDKDFIDPSLDHSGQHCS